MKATHTEGEWEVIYSEDEPMINVFSHKLGYVIAEAQGSDNTEAEANARLIAASPLLLEALFQVLAYEQRGADKGEPRIGGGILNIIHTAIKKAIGEHYYIPDYHEAHDNSKELIEALEILIAFPKEDIEHYLQYGVTLSLNEIQYNQIYNAIKKAKGEQILLALTKQNLLN